MKDSKKDKKSTKSLKDVLKNPSDLFSIVSNPNKGIDLYNSLTTKDKQYVVFAAAAGLIVYGLTLSKKKS